MADGRLVMPAQAKASSATSAAVGRFNAGGLKVNLVVTPVTFAAWRLPARPVSEAVKDHRSRRRCRRRRRWSKKFEIPVRLAGGPVRRAIGVSHDDSAG